MRTLIFGTALAMLAACNCGGKLTTPSESLEVKPSSLDFGTLKVGEERTQSISMRNLGKTLLTVKPELSGDVFGVDTQPFEVDPSAQAFLAVTFRPTKEGAFQQTLELKFSSSSLSVELTGHAEGGVMSCTPKTCAELSRSCGSIDNGCGTPIDCGSCTGRTTCDAETGSCRCASSGRESCTNGVDDDCDGAVDCADSDCAGLGSCATASCSGGTEVRLSQGPNNSTGPDVTFNGSEFGVAFATFPNNGNGTIDFAFTRLSEQGAVLAPAKSLTTSGLMAHPPRLAWNGGEWAVASATLSAGGTMNLVEIQRFNSQGQALSSPLVLGPGWAASIAQRAGASGFGVLWGSSRSSPAFTEVASGARVGSDRLIVSSTLGIDYGDLVHTGNGWGAAWTQADATSNTGTMFARLDSNGMPVGAPQKISVGKAAGNPRIAWSGSHYAVVWVEYTPPEVGVRFARFDANGGAVGAVQTVGPEASSMPDIVWTGNAYAVVWEDSRGAKPTIWLALLDAQGQKVGPDRQVSCGTLGSYRPGVAAAGASLGIVWHDQRNGGYDVYFKREVP